jgi:hypothetical protein
VVLVSLEAAGPGVVQGFFDNVTAMLAAMPGGTVLTRVQIKNLVVAEGRKVGIDIATILMLIQAIMEMLKAFGVIKTSGRRAAAIDIASIIQIIQMILAMLKQFGVIK